MRIVVIDNESAFTSQLEQRYKIENVFCQVFSQPEEALTEMRQNPNAIDLVILSKEQVDDAEGGLKIAEQLRLDPATSGIHYILTFATWDQSDFEKHKETSFAANAYFNKKESLSELDKWIEEVTGSKITILPLTPPEEMSPKENVDSILEVELVSALDILKASDNPSEFIEFSKPISLFTETALETEVESSRAEVVGEPELSSVPEEAIVAAEATPELQAPVSSPEIAPLTKTQSVTPPPFLPRSTIATPPPFLPRSAVAPEIPSSSTPEMVQEKTLPTLEVSVPSSSTPEMVQEKTLPTLEVSVPSLSTPEMVQEKTLPTLEVSIPPITIDNVTQAPPTPPIEPASPAISQEIEIKVETEPAVIEPTSSVEQAIIVVESPATIEQPAAIAEEKIVSEEKYVTLPTNGEQKEIQDMPYLFSVSKSMTASSQISQNMVTGDLNDIENLKKYLMMREQEVSVLNVQISYAKDELEKSTINCQQLHLLNDDLFRQIEGFKNKLQMFEQEQKQFERNKDDEIQALKFELKSKANQVHNLKNKLKESSEKNEVLKERVRLDLQKIRVHEKELENKLEILKKDSETLMASRENKILELKRKIDLLEFNYDTIQNQNEIEKQNVLKIKERLEKVLKAVKLTQGLIESESDEFSSMEEGSSEIKIKAA